MERDDAVLALERHATSKIRLAADLVGVASFGFRGEALPAICSVSQLVVETAPADGAGTAVHAAGGAVQEVRDIARRRGTTVAVSRLFYNAPARQKFLRGARSEWRSVLETMTTIALNRRDVRFTLTHDGKAAFSLAASRTLRDRVASLWGASVADRMVDVEDVRGAIQVSGLAERPADVGTASRRTFITVNGRVVRDNGIIRAAETAYRSTISAGLRPSMLLAGRRAGGQRGRQRASRQGGSALSRSLGRRARRRGRGASRTRHLRRERGAWRATLVGEWRSWERTRRSADVELLRPAALAT